MLLGTDRLLASSRLKGLRVGVLANHASINGNFQHIVDRLAASPDWTLAAIFGPQHGFRSDLQDNMIETPHSEDPRRNVPIFSLYSETREPTPSMLSLIDVLVIDIQDVGARIYTFIYTDGQLPARRGACTESRSSSATAPIRSAASRSKARRWSPATNPSLGFTACPCGTA